MCGCLGTAWAGQTASSAAAERRGRTNNLRCARGRFQDQNLGSRRGWVKWRLIIEQVLAERVEDAQAAWCLVLAERARRSEEGA